MVGYRREGCGEEGRHGRSRRSRYVEEGGRGVRRDQERQVRRRGGGAREWGKTHLEQGPA